MLVADKCDGSLSQFARHYAKEGIENQPANYCMIMVESREVNF